MKTSDKIFFVVLTLILVIGGIIGLCAFASIRTPGGTISITGSSEVEAVADSFDISVSFEKRADTILEAQSVNTQIFDEIIEVLNNAGIDSYRILEENSSTYPEYNWDTNQREIAGYTFNRRIRFEIV